jgi:hypothetical protein
MIEVGIQNVISTVRLILGNHKLTSQINLFFRKENKRLYIIQAKTKNSQPTLITRKKNKRSKRKSKNDRGVSESPENDNATARSAASGPHKESAAETYMHSKDLLQPQDPTKNQLERHTYSKNLLAASGTEKESAVETCVLRGSEVQHSFIYD